MVEELETSNGPTQEWIDAAKKKHGKIFRTVISGEVYVYRHLKRSEFKELQKAVVTEMTPQGPVVSNEQALELEDKICKICVIWPEDFAKIDSPAAAPAILAAHISDSSGAQIEEAPQEL